MEWDEASISRLRAFWAEGLSTAEIGRRMNVSKNAVVGKAHRLNLPARPSPIRRDGEKRPRRKHPPRATGSTLPALSAAASPMPPMTPLSPTAFEPPRPIAERPAPVLRAVPPPRPGARKNPCCWPIGEPGTKSFRFCDVDALGGKPYCEEHAALAYVKVRDRREDAA